MARRAVGAVKTVGWGPFALPGERKRLEQAAERRLAEAQAMEAAERNRADLDAEASGQQVPDDDEQDLIVSLGDDLNKGETADSLYNRASRSLVGGMAGALQGLLSGLDTVSETKERLGGLVETAQLFHADQVNSGQWPADKDDPLVSTLTELIRVLDRVDYQRSASHRRGNTA